LKGLGGLQIHDPRLDNERGGGGGRNEKGLKNAGGARNLMGTETRDIENLKYGGIENQKHVCTKKERKWKDYEGRGDGNRFKERGSGELKAIGET